MAAAAGLFILTGCEGGDLYNVDSPDWISARVDSIKAANQGDEETILYSFGETDYSSGFWSAFSHYYQIPDGQKWEATFNLHINPGDNTYYKNFALVICTDKDRGAAGYSEYGVVRYDYTADSATYNSQWGNFYFCFSTSNSVMSPVDNADKKLQDLNGEVTITVDRTVDDAFTITMDNGAVRKVFAQPYECPGAQGEVIRAFLCVEGSYMECLSTNIQSVEDFLAGDDFQPVSMTLNGGPSEVVIDTPIEEAFATLTATVVFDEGITKNVTAADLQFEAIPNYDEVGQKTLIVIYNKTYKGENANKSVVATKTFSVVKELSAFTETVVVPSPLLLGEEDNTTGWWTAHTENIKVEPKETKVVNFTNYTDGAENWRNFLVVLNGEALNEYAVLRADNFGWGDGYGTCTPSGGQEDWAAWLAAMNGAKVTAYITNNGDGTADVKAVMYGTDGIEYNQSYIGITVNPDDLYFRFTVEGGHLVFDSDLGEPDCSSGWWSAHTTNVQVPSHTVCTVNLTNYTSGLNNWNNFVIVLNKKDLSEYAVVRADNYGWGDSYGACTPSGGQLDWDLWRAAMAGAQVQVQIVNNGDGTADVKAVMYGTDGNDYIQDYIGISPVDPDDFYFRFTVDGCYLKFE